jgi:hypothetical protein
MSLAALRRLRREAEDRIEQLTNLLDEIEGDPDLEDEPAKPDLATCESVSQLMLNAGLPPPLARGYQVLRGLCHVIDARRRRGRRRDLMPLRRQPRAIGEGRRPEFSIRVGGNEMAAGVERVVDGGVSRQEALRGPW